MVNNDNNNKKRADSEQQKLSDNTQESCDSEHIFTEVIDFCVIRDVESGTEFFRGRG